MRKHGEEYISDEKDSVRYNAVLFIVFVAVFGMMAAVGLLLDEYFNNKQDFKYEPPNSSSDSKDIALSEAVSRKESKTDISPVSDNSNNSSQTAETTPPEDSGPETVTAALEYVPTFPMDINQASADDLMQADGIGEKTAGKIIGFRNKNGVITSLEQLIEIEGVGNKIIDKLKEYFYVSDNVYIPYSEPRQTTTSTETVSKTTAPSPETTTVHTTEPQASEHYSNVHINYADAKEISKALLISIAKAEEIVEVRNRIKSFEYIEELALVDSLSYDDIIKFEKYIIID